MPLRGKVVAAIETLPRRQGLLFPAAEGGRINNFRTRERVPALKAAGLEHRRIYDMRHTFATWSLAAGMSIFTLARRMGTSIEMIDRTYGHLASDADAYEADVLDAWDSRTARMGAEWARAIREGATRMLRFAGKPSCGLEPQTPSLPWRCSTN